MSYQPRHSRAVISFFLGLGLSAAAAAPTAAQEADPTIYGALPDVIDAEISPDGKTFAAMQNVNGTKAVVFYDISGGKEAPTGVGLGDADPRSLTWVTNDIALILVSQSDTVSTSSGNQTLEFFRWLAVSKSSQKAELLLGNEPGYYIPTAGSLVSTLPQDPTKVLFARWSSRAGIDTRNTANSRLNTRHESGFGYSLFEVTLKNGRRRMIESGEADTVDWLVDSNGNPVARIDYNPDTEKKSIFMKQGSTFTKTAEWTQKRGEGSYSFQAMTDKPDIALATTYVGDTMALVEFNLRSGEVESTKFTNPRYDVNSVIYNTENMAVEGLRYTDYLPRTLYFDPAKQKMQNDLANALPGSAPMIVSESEDGSKIIVKAIYTDHPNQYFLFDRTARTLDMLATTYSKLDGKVVTKKDRFDFIANDGLSIEGYLAAPVNASKQKMPLIVLPHGGPESRADQSFDYWSFFYAARGYLVYEPNFRGSYGYGADFRAAGYGEWGRKMQDDITEGVKKLIADGIADPDRICIVGGSYGGYAALAGATLTPDLYACAVSVNGVSNLPGMLGEEAHSSELSEDYWEVRIGNRFRDTTELNAVSPSKIAGQAGAPILLIHSKDDIVVPISQSLQMRDALKSAGKPVEYVEFPGEDHWLSTGSVRTQMLQRSIDFIDKYIGQ